MKTNVLLVTVVCNYSIGDSKHHSQAWTLRKSVTIVYTSYPTKITSLWSFLSRGEKIFENSYKENSHGWESTLSNPHWWFSYPLRDFGSDTDGLGWIWKIKPRCQRWGPRTGFWHDCKNWFQHAEPPPLNLLLSLNFSLSICRRF